MIDNPRVELLIARRGRRVAVALALAGVLALFLSGWIVLTPPTTTVTEPTETATISTDADTRAVVTGETDLWEEGTELENNPVYLTNATPTVELEPRTSVPAGANASVTHEVELRIEATRDDRTFWESSEVLLREERRVDDGSAASSTTVDVRELRERLAQVRERLAGVGSVQATLHLTTAYDTGTYQGELTASTPVEVTDRAYWLEEDLSVDETRSKQVTYERAESPNWAAALVFALVGLLALTGAWTIVATGPEDLDVDAIRQELHRRRYSDWISTGTIPMWVGQNHVELDSLEDVVDVAIDTQERVVHDRRRNLFAVISDDVVYYYSKDGDWDRSAWPSVGKLGAGDEPVDVESSVEGPDLGDLNDAFGAGAEPDDAPDEFDGPPGGDESAGDASDDSWF